MKILFLCQYYPPEPGAPAARTHEHAREWVRMGHDVTVVCGIPNHPDGVVPLTYRDHFVYDELHEDVRVLRCWFLTAPNQGRIRRSLAFISFMFAALFWALARGGRADVVMATSPQLLCGLAGYLVALTKRCPFVLEVRDLWPQQIIDLGVLHNRHIIKQLYALEWFLYEKAKAVVTVAEAAKRDIVERGIPSEKVYTITNATDLNFFQPKPREGGLRYRYGWRDLTLVMYIGTHGLSQGLEVVLESAKLLQEQTNLRFVFVGSGAERQALMQRAAAMELTNTEFIPSQPREEMPDFYAAADICLVPLKRRDIFLTNIPSKMFEIMACGRPMILGVEGQAKQLLQEAGAGIAVPPEDAQALARAIASLAEHPEQCQLYGNAGRKHMEEHYSRSSRAQALLHILADTADKKR